MSGEKFKLREILSCPFCFLKYNEKNLPKILPCGNTLCQNCIEKETKYLKNDTEAYYNCKLCGNEHNSLKKNGFATNEILLKFFDLSKENTAEYKSILKNTQRNEISKSEFMSYNELEKLSQVLKELEANTNNLDNCIKNSRRNMQSHFNSLENEINNRTQKAISELNEYRENILNELNVHKKKSLAFVNDGLGETSPIVMFQKECQNNYAQLLEVSKLKENDKQELNNIINYASDLNKKIAQTKLYFQNCINFNLRLTNPKQSVNSFLIGNLEIINNPDASLPTKNLFKSNSIRKFHQPDSIKHKVITYKIPINLKNIFINVFDKKLILKAAEMVVVEDFNYVISLQLINTDGTFLKKTNDSIESFRMKKIQVCNSNCFVAVILVNQYLDVYCLKLYDNELRPTKMIDLHYVPTDLYMNKNGIYVKTANLNTIIHKYNYNLDYLRSLGQASDENRQFYFPKSLKLNNILDDKFVFIEKTIDSLKIKLISEHSGKFIKSVYLDNENKNYLIKIDQMNRIIILNTKKGAFNIFNLNGEILNERKIDTNVQFADDFFPLKDDQFAILDLRNHSIHFI